MKRSAMASEPKTALVLSAGGMFGAYQAGVWDAIADVFQPDIVVGASVGSLNGWLIAGDVPSTYLSERWLDLEPASRLRFRLPGSLAAGLLNGDYLQAWIQQMHAEVRPRRQFGLVSTRWPDLQQRLFHGDQVTWQHLAASCAIPGVFPQHKLDTHWYSDGGLLDPLPLWAAFEMGATKVVAVNVMANRPGPFRWVSTVACRYARFQPADCKAGDVLSINPANRLGPVMDSLRWSRQNAANWMEAGRQDGLRNRTLIVECLKQQ